MLRVGNLMAGIGGLVGLVALTAAGGPLGLLAAPLGLLAGRQLAEGLFGEDDGDDDLDD